MFTSALFKLKTENMLSFSKIGCEEPRRVHKIELLQDTIGNTHYMIITLHTEPKTMIFQRRN